MKKPVQIFMAIIYISAAALLAGCGVVNTERDGMNDPRSGSYQFPNMVLTVDGDSVENGGTCFLPMTEIGTTQDLTFII